MKRSLTLVAIGAICSCGFSQTIKEKDVPVLVVQAFQKDFTGVKVKKWEKEGANYEVDFELNKIENSAVYDAVGKRIEHEIEIQPSELPNFVLAYFEKNLPGKKIKEASKITDADGTVTYEAKVDDTEYKFQEAVGMINKETEKKEEKE